MTLLGYVDGRKSCPSHKVHNGEEPFQEWSILTNILMVYTQKSVLNTMSFKGKM